MARNRLTMLDVDEVSAVNKAANGKKFLILKAATPVEAEPPEDEATEQDVLTQLDALLGKIADQIKGQTGSPTARTLLAEARKKLGGILGDKVQKAEATKTEAGESGFTAEDYAYTPDPDKPSDWKLRLTKTPGGGPDAGLVGGCVAALGKGFRGQKVDIPDADLPAVKAKVRAAWLKANPDKKAADIPEVIAKEEKPSGLAWVREALRKAVGIAGPTTEDDEMTTEEIQEAVAKALTDGLAPITERLDKVEKALTQEPTGEVTPEAAATTPVETESVTMDAIAKQVGDAVSAAVAPLAERLEKVESASGQRQSAIPAAAAQSVQKSMWSGVL